MNKFTSYSCSIGIVTYLGRFEEYFKPLVRKLYFLFPDYDINIFINGHYDTVRQITYLRDVTCFLRHYPNICYVTNLEHQPLARGWNWLVMMAKCDRVLILNDDISFNYEVRRNLERLPSLFDVCTINGSWSHFVIDKEIIRQVGWFDERFSGVGDEDYDYIFRLALKDIPLKNIQLFGLHNFVAPMEEAGWANISGKIHGKYSQHNREFLRKKWLISEHNAASKGKILKINCCQEEWEIGINNKLEAMPEYYPRECLRNIYAEKININICVLTTLAKACSFFSVIYWKIRRALSDFLRGLLGPRWDKLRGGKAIG